jgi:hypothetical protein
VRAESGPLELEAEVVSSGGTASGHELSFPEARKDTS